MEAEQNTGETANAVSVDEKTGTGGTEEEGLQEQKNAVVADDIANRIDQAVTRWTAAGMHLRSGINCPEAADEMHLPRYQFSLWLKQNGTNYREWLNGLRIKEAKRLLKAHPEWSNEAIAQHCGFSDRSYFQKVFKERTGLTPAQYMEGKRRG